MRYPFLAAVLSAATILPPPAIADVFMFQTPSGNIQCSVGLEVDFADVRCTIVERSGPPAAPRPSNCAAAWGHDFILGEFGPVEMACAKQPRRFAIDDIANYGVTGTFGRITCLSQSTGFTCRNADGHGFFLSRRSQLAF